MESQRKFYNYVLKGDVKEKTFESIMNIFCNSVVGNFIRQQKGNKSSLKTTWLGSLKTRIVNNLKLQVR